jgi:mRNA interferase RelE/StbE
MHVLLSKKARSQYSKLNEPIKGRVKNSLQQLSYEPPQGNIKKLAGRDGYRLRIGDYRVLYKLRDGKIVVTNIEPRGDAYKGV